MSDDIEKLNAIFSTPDEPEPQKAKPAPKSAPAKKRIKKVDKLFLDTSGKEKSNYTGDTASERDYRPVRQSHEYRSGCLGGIMYFAFILCISVVIASVGWMAASDMLALNKDDFTAVVKLPPSAFTSETVDTFDNKGIKTGTKKVNHADISYVSNELKNAGLIQYKWLFETFCKISTAETKLSPGEYELKSTYDYRALISHMRVGSSSTVTISVTIPEGFRMHQIFLRLEENGVCSYEDLMEAAANYSYDYDFLDPDSVGDATRLEGYLFPDTYEFYVGMQASSAINKMLDNFSKRWTDDMQARVDELGMSVNDIVTVASLIEKEAANDDERSKIASVIYNRFNADMVLGIDASVLYPYPDHEGAPTKEMLETDSPYNTRLNFGFPPTPIASPGIASLNAALFPAATEYYYYALDTEAGVHQFFTNETEFNSFVATQDYGQQ